MDLSHLNPLHCPCCDGYLYNFCRPTLPNTSASARVCSECSGDNKSTCVIQFDEDNLHPLYIILTYQDLGATIFFATLHNPTPYTHIHSYATHRKLLGVLDGILDLDLTQPQEFLHTLRTLILFS